MTFLEAAHEIGRALCAAAYWDDEGRMCNWLGRADREGIAPGTVTPATGAIEQNLYRGSTGVALFLAELSVLTGGEDLRRTALGGLRRSIWYFLNRPLERAVPLSFFLGHLGAAYVARRLLDTGVEAELEEDIGRLLAAVEGSLAEPHPLDLLGGNAGAIPALLHLARRGHAGCRELAVRCGLELRRSAERQGPGVTWRGEEVAGPVSGGAPSPALTGFSHGASGLALALLELHGETGDVELRDLARGAFAYEDTFFSPADGNWRDPREAVAAAGFQTAWCHGAPGIALARLRALNLDPELREAHAATARIALGTALAALERGLARPRHDATLCHGLAGLSEILLLGGTLLDEPVYQDAAQRAASELIRRHATVGGIGDIGDWPSGMPSGGASPALMLGTAGIGHHLLRLHAPERVPPVLVLLPS